MLTFNKPKLLAGLHEATSAVVTVDGVTSLQFDSIKLFVRSVLRMLRSTTKAKNYAPCLAMTTSPPTVACLLI